MEYLYSLNSFQSKPFSIEDPYYHVEPLTFGSDPRNDEELNDTKNKFFESLPPSLPNDPNGVSANGQELKSSISFIAVGEFEIPEMDPPVAFDPNLSQYQDYLNITQLEPYVPQDYLNTYQDYLNDTQPYPYLLPRNYSVQYQEYLDNSQPDPYVEPQGCGVPYHDLSYIGYPNVSTNNTYWELDVCAHPNSIFTLKSYHTMPGIRAFTAPEDFVIQQCKELGNLPASGCDQSGFTSSPEMLYPITSPPLIPDLFPTTDCSLFPTNPEDPPPSSSFPFTNQSASPRTKPRPCPRTLKAGRKIKKPFNPSKNVIRRKSSKGRVKPQSQPWLDTVFCQGLCKHCTGGSKDNRKDRLLEHLVSSHFIQPIKNMEHYGREELENKAEFRTHYIRTQAQFEYTRRFIDSVKCSLCSKETSLVFRDYKIAKHLEAVHADEDETTREEELARLMELAPDEKRWYSIYDKFLCEFPHY